MIKLLLLCFVVTLNSTKQLNENFKKGMIFHGMGRTLVTNQKFTPKGTVNTWMTDWDGFFNMISGSFISSEHQLHETYHGHFGILFDPNDSNVLGHVASDVDLGVNNPLGVTAPGGGAASWNKKDHNLCLKGSNKNLERNIVNVGIGSGGVEVIANDCYKGAVSQPANGWFNSGNLQNNLQKIVPPNRPLKEKWGNQKLTHNEVLFSAFAKNIRAVVLMVPKGLVYTIGPKVPEDKYEKKINVAPLAASLYKELKKHFPDIQFVKSEFYDREDCKYLQQTDWKHCRKKIGKLIPINADDIQDEDEQDGSAVALSLIAALIISLVAL